MLPMACIFAFCMLANKHLNAQIFGNSGAWQLNRTEFVIGFGATNFLGDLGGKDSQGSNFLSDLEISQTKPAFNLGLRYFALRHFAIRGGVHYGMVSGDDKLTEEPYRKNRNLHFRSSIMEFSLLVEFHITETVLGGSQYNLAGVNGTDRNTIGAYLFAGFASFRFNPKAKFDGQWVELQPLGTEGQGLEPGTSPYSLTSTAIPVGFGVRLPLNKAFVLSSEMSYRLTTTDYLDDVSTVYYDNDAIRDARGEMAAYLADPSLGDVEGVFGNPTAPGQQRGDPEDNDAYLFITFNLNYKLNQPLSFGKRKSSRAKRQRPIF